MIQRGKIQIGDTILDAEIDMEEKRAPLTTEQKLEIGQMLREGVSQAGIEIVIESWCVQPNVSYATFVEYGKPPTNDANVVEGSITCPITDEGRLLK